MDRTLQGKIDKQVIVKTRDVVYRGRLVETTENTICLMARTGWREVPMERIISVELVPGPAETDPED